MANPSDKTHSEKFARESFKDEALASWADFQKIGRHVTGAEAQKWLASWGTAAETAMPTCHEQSTRTITHNVSKHEIVQFIIKTIRF